MNVKEFFKKGYKDSWETMKKSKSFIFIALGIFFVFSIVGFIFPIFFVDEINSIIQTMILSFEGLTVFQTIIKIFSNNLMSCIYSMLLGLGFGAMPLFNSVLNGYLLGFVGNSAVIESGASILLRLLPHGIFELPAIFISIGSGFFLADSFTKNVIKIKKPKWRKLIILCISIVLLPLLVYQSMTVASIDLSSLESGTLASLPPSIIILTVINLLVFVGFAFVAVHSLRNKEVKKDLKSNHGVVQVALI